MAAFCRRDRDRVSITLALHVQHQPTLLIPAFRPFPLFFALSPVPLAIQTLFFIVYNLFLKR